MNQHTIFNTIVLSSAIHPTNCPSNLQNITAPVDKDSMDKNIQSGFTLIELLVAMSVAAILLGVGIPSFAEAVKNSRTSVRYNELVQALYLTRSEAVKTSQNVTLCARQDDTSCGTDWNNGWIVFIDNQSSTFENQAQIDAGDEILQIEQELDDHNTIVNIGSIDRSSTTATARSYFRYQSNGLTNWTNGSYFICDERGEEYSRSINIALTGDIQRGRPSAGNQIPMDVFGRELSCP